MQARSTKPSTAKKAAQGRAVRAHKAHVRPEGPVGRGGLRRPRFGFLGESSGEAAVLYVLLVLFVLPRRPPWLSRKTREAQGMGIGSEAQRAER